MFRLTSKTRLKKLDLLRHAAFVVILFFSSPSMALETINVLVGLSQNADADPNIDLLDIIEEMNTGMPIYSRTFKYSNQAIHFLSVSDQYLIFRAN